MKVSIDFIVGYKNGGGTTHGVTCQDVERTFVENGLYYVVYSTGKHTSMFPIQNIAKISECTE